MIIIPTIIYIYSYNISFIDIYLQFFYVNIKKL